MIVFRLTRKKHMNDFSGKGAALCGARWNSKGVEVIYASESRALAMAEVAVHLSLDTLPKDFVMLEIEIPDTVSFSPALLPDSLDSNWNMFPHQLNTQQIGDQFVNDNQYCVLKVPSAVVKGDFNLLINAYHPDFQQIKVIGFEDFPFDQRYIYH